jgi:sulfotransferase
MEHELVFLSGLPRSGSTVLSSLLNQHPKIYATTTSPVLGMILNFGGNWENQVVHQIEDKSEQQKTDMQRSMLLSAHSHFNKPIIVDKNRGWPRHVKLLEKLLGKKPKIICTVRDVPSVLSSFVTLANKHPDNNFIDNQLKMAGFTVNNTNRCRLLWRQGTVGAGWDSLKSGYQYDKSCLLLISYEEIVNDPLSVMKRVEDFLGIEHHLYDINNLKAMDEKDEEHGLKGLHDIRPVVKKTSPPPEKIIGVGLTKYYNDMKLNFWNK